MHIRAFRYFRSSSLRQRTTAQFERVSTIADLLGFTHQTSSPYYPQANGQSERAVQVAKTILRQSDPMLALLAYRSTPHVSTGFSPAQLLMGRRIQSRLPTLPSALQPKWPNSDVISENDRLAKESSTLFYNRKYGAKQLTQFEGGESVRIKTDAQKVWGNPTVVVRADTPRSYIIRFYVQTQTGVTCKKFLYRTSICARRRI